MDINSLLSMVLGGGNTDEISQKSGASQQDVSSVLTSALPLLLGGKSEKATAKEVSKNTGLNLNTILSILAAAAPLLQSLLGGGSGDQASSGNGLANLLGSLLGGGSSSSSGGGLGGLFTSLFGGGSSSESTAAPAASAASQPTVIKNPNKKTTAKKTTAAKTTAAKTTAAKKPTTAKTTTAKKTTGRK